MTSLVQTSFVPGWMMGVLLIMLVIALITWAFKASADADLDADEEDPHEWVDVPEGTQWRGQIAFRFCDRCDREEYVDGFVRDGYLVDGGECA